MTRTYRGISVFALCLGILSGLSPSIVLAKSADYGPAESIRETRHDSLLLLAHQWLTSGELSTVIESVVTDGKTAVVQWRAGSRRRGVIVLLRQDGRWTWRAGALTVDYPDGYWSKVGPGEGDLCFQGATQSPTVDDLQRSGFIDADFAKILVGRLKVYKQTKHPTPAPVEACDSFGIYLTDTTNSYDATFTGGQQNLDKTLGLRRYDGCEHSIYGFSLVNIADVSYTTPANGELTVWFPYVLQTDRHYQLKLVGAGPDRTIAGDLHDNALDFVLPQYVLPISASVNGCVQAASSTN